MSNDKNIRVFKGATAIITGGASGIGRGFAEELAKRGCEVVLADLQIELAEEVASAINTSGGRARAVKTDVTDFTQVDRLVRECVSLSGRLDYMFNNAGIGIAGDVRHYGMEDWNYILDVNLRGVINGVQAAYRVMLDQGFGHIINTASVGGLLPSPGNVAYAATKHGVVGLSTSLRAEAARTGVRVSVLCPGFVRTAIFDGGGKYGRILMDMTPELQRRLLEMVEKLKPMSPNTLAQKALRSIQKNKALIIVPLWWKVFWCLFCLFPSPVISLTSKTFLSTQKKLGIK
ncbi:SDR family oxidoreductase [Deltaproteobacteria bacterium]|nr:SDR family oxidoreductase [Deltaproteobacteria bacterium]